MILDVPLTRRSLLVLGACFARRLLAPRTTATGSATSDAIIVGVLVPAAASDPGTASPRALAGIRLGAEEAARSATLLGQTITLQERPGTSVADAQALVGSGAVVVLTGLAPGASKEIGITGGMPGVPII